MAGNILKCNFNATRSSEASGNITNETVCTFSVNHGGKIKGCYIVSFPSGNTSGGAFFQTSNISIDGDILTFNVNATAYVESTTKSSSNFAVPVYIDLSAY